MLQTCLHRGNVPALGVVDQARLALFNLPFAILTTAQHLSRGLVLRHSVLARGLEVGPPTPLQGDGGVAPAAEGGGHAAAGGAAAGGGGGAGLRLAAGQDLQ